MSLSSLLCSPPWPGSGQLYFGQVGHMLRLCWLTLCDRGEASPLEKTLQEGGTKRTMSIGGSQTASEVFLIQPQQATVHSHRTQKKPASVSPLLFTCSVCTSHCMKPRVYIHYLKHHGKTTKTHSSACEVTWRNAAMETSHFLKKNQRWRWMKKSLYRIWFVFFNINQSYSIYGSIFTHQLALKLPPTSLCM